MKFKKSKPQSQLLPEVEKNEKATFFGIKKTAEELSLKEKRLLIEEKKRRRTERVTKIKKGVGQFFIVLFVLAVIFSMIVVPLLIVFG